MAIGLLSTAEGRPGDQKHINIDRPTGWSVPRWSSSAHELDAMHAACVVQWQRRTRRMTMAGDGRRWSMMGDDGRIPMDGDGGGAHRLSSVDDARVMPADCSESNSIVQTVLAAVVVASSKSAAPTPLATNTSVGVYIQTTPSSPRPVGPSGQPHDTTSTRGYMYHTPKTASF